MNKKEKVIAAFLSVLFTVGCSRMEHPSPEAIKADIIKMGHTKGEQYIYFYVTPGKHTIYSDAERV